MTALHSFTQALAPVIVWFETLTLCQLTLLIVSTTSILAWLTYPSQRPNDYSRGPLTQKGREALAVHHYKSSAYTVLDNLLNPWWDWAARRLPKTIAPNVVTLVGWIFYYPADILVLLSDGQPDAVRPAWIYAIGAFAVFWYQTFDAMDGKQARALGVAGPLGQIMDHGCDAVSTVLLTVLTTSALRLDMSGYIGMGFCFLYCFWVGNWAEKYTHVLMTSMSHYFGVTEGQYLSVAIQTVAFFVPDFWQRPIASIIGQQELLAYPNAAVHAVVRFLIAITAPWNDLISTQVLPRHLEFDFHALPLGYIFVWIAMLSGIYVFFMTLIDVAVHIIQETPQQLQKEQSTQRPFVAIIQNLCIAFLELIPITYVLVLGVAWYLYSAPSEIKPFAGSFEYYPLISVVGFSFVFVHYICQVIMATMSNELFPLIHVSVVPFSILIGIDIWPTFSADHQPVLSQQYHIALWIFACVTAVIFQVRWALRVVHQIADLFGIHILRLGKRPGVAPIEVLRKTILEREKIQAQRGRGVIDMSPVAFADESRPATVPQPKNPAASVKRSASKSRPARGVSSTRSRA